MSLFSTPISAKSLATITRQLSTLIGTDVRIEEALLLVASQLSPSSAAATIKDIRRRVIGGHSFARAIREGGASFPDFYCASIASAEQSGNMAEVLSHLANFVEARSRSINKLRLALVYPALLGFISIAMVTALLVYVVPDIARVFSSRGAQLPWLTRGLIALSDGVRSYGLVALAAAAVAGAWWRHWLTNPLNRLAFHRLVATRWPFRQFSRQAAAARFTASLATLIQSDVALVNALETASNAVSNQWLMQQISAVGGRVAQGMSLHRAMALAEVFPPMLVAMVASGESSGRLGPVLARAAADLDHDFNALVATLMALIEPAVLLVMGAVVLLMVLAILLPIVGLNSLAGT